MGSVIHRRFKNALVYRLTGIAVLAFTMSAFGQARSAGGTGGSSTSGGFGGSSGFGVSSGTGGSSMGGGSFGISSGSSGSGLSSSSAFGTGTGSTASGAGSAFGTGTNAGGAGGMGTRSGQYGTGTSGTSGPFFPTPSTSNPLANYYLNPLAPGTVNATKSTFGQPIYATVTTTNASGSRGGGGSGMNGAGATGVTIPPSPRYTVGLDFNTVSPGVSRIALSSRAQAEVQGVFSRSSALGLNSNVQVQLDKGTLVLQGKVASEHDRRIAEGMARLTPGVYALRNELQVSP